jgi:hypothetical protein
MVGGGGITGGSSMGGTAIPGIAGAREDGGPIKGSDQPLPRKLYDPSRPEGDRFVPTTAAALAKDSGAGAVTKETAAERADQDAADHLMPLLYGIGYQNPLGSPGLTLLAATGGAGAGAAAAKLRAEDEASQKARAEQAAIEADRAAMNRADRGGGPAVAPKRSLWDLLRGK